MSRRGLWVAILLLAFIGGAGVAFWQLTKPYFPADGNRTTTTGQALIGGPFTLTDHTGRTVTEADLKGRYTLIYFGFTYCPDICPAGLQTIAAALDAAGPAGEKVVPWFVTVDPERDTPEQLASYVGLFHPRLLGLTGSAEQVRAMARAYKVYYAKVDDPGSGGGYTIDHSSITYLMDKNGKYLSHFTHDENAAAMAEKLRHLVN